MKLEGSREYAPGKLKKTMIQRFALIIGAMKAGTTTIFDHLAQHPHICGCSPKEPGFFAFDEVFARGRGWYEGLFDYDDGAHRWALDASTDYSKAPHADGVPARLAAFGGEFRLIYSMRNPLRRIESHALHVQHKRRELGRIDSDRPDHSLDAGVSQISMNICRYASQLDQYRDYFDRGAVFLTSTERLAADPGAVLGDICRFLDLDPALLPAEVTQRNAGDQKWRAREIHPLWRFASSIAPLKAAAKAITPAGFRDRLRLKTRPQTSVEGRFKLTAAEETQIIAQLTPDLVRLRDEYGFDCAREWGVQL
ncbi:MAG: sulfotransferase domain-containing protein [Parvularculaceae bacterium]|nr:sulfotransferase domain-containing protein [Parvularculaceae bacterium]